MTTTHTLTSPSKGLRSQSSDDKNDIWSSLLDGVASGKRLPEKNVLVLGGSRDVQKEFLEILGSDNAKKQHERYRKKSSVANEFALGYTYQDVLDADHEDTLARLSIYTLSEPSLSFGSLLKPLLTPTSIPETLLIILLDWNEPWNWVRQIRDWVQLLHRILSSLDESTKLVMQEVMQDWEQRRRGGSHEIGGGGTGADLGVTIPLGPGEWDEALGLPLCVACHNADRIDPLEKEANWREEEFDYILQFLRTILLKHGGSLIYTSSSFPNSLSRLVQSSLGIHSVLKKQSLKHNVIDRDRILIPPNWDSWGKIRVLREGFDVEGVSEGWSIEIQPVDQIVGHSNGRDNAEDTHNNESQAADQSNKGTLTTYEDTIKDPKGASTVDNLTSPRNGQEIEVLVMQEFLSAQSEAMERLKQDEEQSQDKEGKHNTSSLSYGRNYDDDPTMEQSGRVNEHIGPVQFNMGGIQVDAEDVLKKLKEREREETPDREGPAAAPVADGKQQNEALANFFAGLIKRGGANSPKP